MNPFSRNIGIYYKNGKWADELYDKIIKNATTAIDHNRGATVKTGWAKRIIFLDGTCVRFIKANDNCRGCRFDECYIQSGISYEIYRSLIRPCTRGVCYIIDDYNDLVDPNGKIKDIFYYDLIKKEIRKKEEKRNVRIQSNNFKCRGWRHIRPGY